MACVLALLASVALPAAAGQRSGVVVDQTSAPVPGVTLQVVEAASPTASTVSGADGTFVLPNCPAGATVTATLPGFDATSVACADAARIVLKLAALTATEEVTAAVGDSESPTSARLGGGLSGATLARLPTATQHAREALPLLPSVVRGTDGLLRIDGVRPHEAPLLFDGFDVTDPATGVSSIDPPIESVANVAVLRDPMAVTFGDALGSMASIETRTGGDTLDAGVQGFLPRPRLSSQGFLTLEGFSPRAHVGGQSGPVRFFAAAEYDYNRFPVPDVTTSSGKPDSRDINATVFGRADVQVSASDVLSVEGLVFPSNKMYHGLSPLRTVDASPTLQSRDAFGGLVDRHSFGADETLTLRLGVLSHYGAQQPNGNGQPEITPSGWSGGLFSSVAQTASRLEGSASYQRKLRTSWGVHEVTVQGSLQRQSLDGSVNEKPVDVLDAAGTLVRRISFGTPTTTQAAGSDLGLAVRDLWRASERLEVDAGVREDWSTLGGSAPSTRIGFRYTTGTSGATVIKGGVGEFVGTVPLSVPAFADYPVRFDQTVAPDGETVQTTVLRPAVAQLALPRALAANLRVEREVAPGWDAALGVTVREASHLATLDVLAEQGTLLVSSTGESSYRSAEAVVRHTWGAEDQLLVAYTWSRARGDVNDFSSLFARGDVEILQPGGETRLSTDAPHRLLAWGTFTLPAGFSISPAVDWHSGFPYSLVDARQAYLGAPNSRSYPAFFSLDVVLYKTLTVAAKHVKMNVQVFNVTNHFNPRDVYNTLGGAQFGTFTNSVGPTIRGDVAVNW
ncbi:MAG TPA: carboxypeptidase regulatory-like domain-containing protein [Vicinamibacteria bacterium]|nr:carboxypeptidase regulatory-like domain-containing protein [Vicinamibacteria bacterium]